MLGRLNKIFNPIKKTFPENFKKRLNDGTLNTIETTNQCRDIIYNRQFPGSQFKKIDTFNDSVTDLLYLSDNFIPFPIGHFAATYGRDVRNNYQFNYERSPFMDNFERAWDAFKKATEYDY